MQSDTAKWIANFMVTDPTVTQKLGWDGSKWVNMDESGMVNPMTQEGDMIYEHNGAPEPLHIGAVGTGLMTLDGLDPIWDFFKIDSTYFDGDLVNTDLSPKDTGVTPGSYTYASFTVGPKGTLSAASSGVDPVTSVSAGDGISVAGTTTPTVSVADTSVTPGSYTNASVTFNSRGQATSASNGTAPVTSVSGGTGISVTGGATTPTVNLADTAVTPSTYLSPTIAVDQQGRITSASNGNKLAAVWRQNQSITSGGFNTVLANNTETYTVINTGSHLATGTGLYSVTDTGMWRCTCCIQPNGNWNPVILAIRVTFLDTSGSTTYQLGQNTITVGSSAFWCLSTSTVIKADPGDKLSFDVFQQTGSSQTCHIECSITWEGTG